MNFWISYYLDRYMLVKFVVKFNDPTYFKCGFSYRSHYKVWTYIFLGIYASREGVRPRKEQRFGWVVIHQSISFICISGSFSSWERSGYDVMISVSLPSIRQHKNQLNPAWTDMDARTVWFRKFMLFSWHFPSMPPMKWEIKFELAWGEDKR